MRALVQRVAEADVVVGGRSVGSIGRGLCVLVGVTHDDGPDEARKVADKLWNLRLFDDEDGVMNRSVAQIGGELLVISQFTLYGDTAKGRRPSWRRAAAPQHAEPLVTTVVEELRALGATVATGVFRAEMAVTLTNDGPSTIMIEV